MQTSISYKVSEEVNNKGVVEFQFFKPLRERIVSLNKIEQFEKSG